MCGTYWSTEAKPTKGKKVERGVWRKNKNKQTNKWNNCRFWNKCVDFVQKKSLRFNTYMQYVLACWMEFQSFQNGSKARNQTESSWKLTLFIQDWHNTLTQEMNFGRIRTFVLTVLLLLLRFPSVVFLFHAGKSLYYTRQLQKNHLLSYLLASVLFICFYLIYWFTAKASLPTVLPLWLKSVNTILNAARCVATMGAGEPCVCLHMSEFFLALLSL